MEVSVHTRQREWSDEGNKLRMVQNEVLLYARVSQGLIPQLQEEVDDEVVEERLGPAALGRRRRWPRSKM